MSAAFCPANRRRLLKKYWDCRPGGALCGDSMAKIGTETAELDGAPKTMLKTKGFYLQNQFLDKRKKEQRKHKDEQEERKHTR